MPQAFHLPGVRKHRADDQRVLTVKQHALVVVVVVLLGHFLLSVAEPLSQLLVHNFLNL